MQRWFEVFNQLSVGKKSGALTISLFVVLIVFAVVAFIANELHWNRLVTAIWSAYGVLWLLTAVYVGRLSYLAFVNPELSFYPDRLIALVSTLITCAPFFVAIGAVLLLFLGFVGNLGGR